MTTNNAVIITFQLKSIEIFPVASTSAEALSANGLGSADRQSSVKTGTASIHCSPNTIGTYINAKPACKVMSGVAISAMCFKLFVKRFFSSL